MERHPRILTENAFPIRALEVEVLSIKVTTIEKELLSGSGTGFIFFISIIAADTERALALPADAGKPSRHRSQIPGVTGSTLRLVSLEDGYMTD